MRERLAELLALLPLHAGIESLREVLQRSGLGRVVHFYATLEGETASDRERGNTFFHGWGRGGCLGRPRPAPRFGLRWALALVSTP